MKRLMINGKQAALKENTVIQTTVQSFTTDLTSRRISYTNEVLLPYVQANKDIFESCEVIDVETDIPYRKVTIQYYEGGTAIIPYGFGVLSETATDGYKLQIYGNTKSFFDSLGDKSLNDLDFNEAATTWNDATIAARRRKSTNTIFAPLVQYGQINLSISTFNIGKTLPSVAYDKTIQTIFTNAGFRYIGNVFNNQEFKDLFIPYSRPSFDFGSTYRYQYKYEITKAWDLDPYDVYIANLNHRSNIQFDKPTQVSLGNFGTNLPRSAKQDITLEITIQVINGASGASCKCQIVGYPIVSSVSTVYSSNTVSLSSGIKTMKIEISGLNIPVSGQTFNLDFVVTNNTGLTNNTTTVRFISGTLQNKVYGANQETTNPTFLPQEVLPDIKQIDFIKDWAMMFGLLFDVGTTYYPGDTVLVRSFNEVLNGTEIEDWTHKRNTAVKPSSKFAYQGYGQSNRFRWADDVTGSFGEIAIPNENLEQVVDYYMSLFKATPEVTLTNSGGQSITCINLNSIPGSSWDYTQSITDEGYRLAYAELNTSSVNCRYNGVLVSDYDIGKFATRLDWGRIIRLYYSRLVECLQAVRIVTNQYTLNSEDVNKASSPFQIIRDGNQNYLCMTIDRWIAGLKCNATLFRIR